MREYWVHNRGTAAPALVWDAFKAHARGQYQTMSSLSLEEAEHKVQVLEAHYVVSREEVTYKATVCKYCIKKLH